MEDAVETTTGEETSQETTDINPAELDAAALDAALGEGEPERTEEVEKEEPAIEPEIDQQPAVETEVEVQTKLEKQLKDKEEFIQRRNAEVGELRKQIEALQQRIPQVQEDGYYENPVDAVNQVLQAREQQAQIQYLEHQAAIKQNELTIKEFVPEFDSLVDDMVEVIRDLKYPQEVINNFKANPYAEQPAILVNLAERAKLAKENKTLKAEIEKLKKAPGDVLKKVEAAANSSRPLTAATGNSGNRAISDKQVHQLSDKELDELLR